MRSSSGPARRSQLVKRAPHRLGRSTVDAAQPAASVRLWPLARRTGEHKGRCVVRSNGNRRTMYAAENFRKDRAKLLAEIEATRTPEQRGEAAGLERSGPLMTRCRTAGKRRSKSWRCSTPSPQLLLLKLALIQTLASMRKVPNRTSVARSRGAALFRAWGNHRPTGSQEHGRCNQARRT